MKAYLPVLSALLGCGQALVVPPPEGDLELAPGSAENGPDGDAGAPSADGGASPRRARDESPPSSDAQASDAPCTPLEHANGTGQTYVSCRAIGAHDAASAMLACGAYVDGKPGSACVTKTTGTCANQAVVTVVPSGQTGATWAYGGEAIGHVALFVGASVCPTMSHGTWE